MSSDPSDLQSKLVFLEPISLESPISTVAMPELNGADEECIYTPTTHRISKSKKGRKVHACEYPGCPKV